MKKLKIALGLSFLLNLILIGAVVSMSVQSDGTDERDAKRRSEATLLTIDLREKYPVSSDWKKVDSAALQFSISTPPDWITRDDDANNVLIIQNPAFQQEGVPASVTLTTDNPHGIILTFEKLSKDGRMFDERAVPSSDSIVTRKRKIKLGNDSGVLIDSYSLFEHGPYVFYALDAWVDQGDDVLHVLVSFRDQKVFQDLYEEQVLSIIGSAKEN